MMLLMMENARFKAYVKFFKGGMWQRQTKSLVLVFACRSLAAMQMIKIITWSGSLYFSLFFLFFFWFLLATGIAVAVAVETATATAAPYKRQAQSQLQNDENEFSLQTKLKVSAVAKKAKKKTSKKDGSGQQAATTVRARKLHTKSNDVQSYFSQVLCRRRNLEPTRNTQTRTRTRNRSRSRTQTRSQTVEPSPAAVYSCCRLHMGPCDCVNLG